MNTMIVVPAGSVPGLPGRRPRAPESGHRSAGWQPGPEAGLLSRVLDEVDCGLMVVDARARLRLANRLANRLALAGPDASPCVSVVAGQVRLHPPRADEALQRACAAAAEAGRRSLVSAQAGGGQLALSVVPLGAFDDEPAVLLVMGRQRVCAPLSVQFFAREHRLTPAETEVLRHLCGGASPAEIARLGNVAVSTVRSHIANMRHKTGAHTANGLVRMVALLPPIVAVVGG